MAREHLRSAPVARSQGADADLAIVSAFSDPDGERRYWEVPGFARVPCGGTHLRRTGKIGCIDLKRKNVGSGKERIEIYLVREGCRDGGFRGRLDH